MAIRFLEQNNINLWMSLVMNRNEPPAFVEERETKMYYKLD